MRKKVIAFVFMALSIQAIGADSPYLEFRHRLADSVSPLEVYLESHRVYELHKDQLAGHMTDAQKSQMSEVLASYSDIRKIGEIGLNFGHSADHFFNQCPQIEEFYSFDINFIPKVVEYFSSQYKNRFHFFHGNSLETVPEFSSRSEETKLDLIFIDGGHSFNECSQDILNMHALAHPKTNLWIDDYHSPEVFEAVEYCKNLRVLEVVAIHVSDFKTSAERCWIEARYLSE